MSKKLSNNMDQKYSYLLSSNLPKWTQSRMKKNYECRSRIAIFSIIFNLIYFTKKKKKNKLKFLMNYKNNTKQKVLMLEYGKLEQSEKVISCTKTLAFP